ncbi:hypothetical protein AYO38_02085 [bacterium SCGC AG-212-C10]|nr:hypothetical protein AYO38_02085 [bacterium SCGC AG-212-C10]
MRPVSRHLLFGTAIVGAMSISLLALVLYSRQPKALPVSPTSVTPGAVVTPTPTRERDTVQPPSPSPSATSTATAVSTIGPLTGLPAEDPANQRALAVMIDNIDGAGLQPGLAQADVVVEGLVEGGITRLMAIFQSRPAAAVEPVRSVRVPFVQWADAFDAVIAHVGMAEEPGPADVRVALRELRVDDIDYEGSNAAEAAFRRDPQRFAPHNVITSTDALREVMAARKLRAAAPRPLWQFHRATAPGASALSVNIDFGVGSFEDSWKWDEASATYARSQYFAPHLDGTTRKQLTAANVIVVFAPAYVADGVGHVLYEFEGSGRILVFSGGTAIEGTWKRPSSTSTFSFTDANGQLLALNAGQTWIELVDHTGSATYR